MSEGSARHDEDWRVQQVWTVTSTTNEIQELEGRLICQGVQRVVMEATGSYWKPFFFLLEARGLECWLVNACDVKNVPGRPETERLDAVWLATLAERGVVRASFVPSKPVRQLRDFTRTRTVFIQERTRHKHRVEKALEDAQIKLSSVVSDLFGVSGRSTPWSPASAPPRFWRSSPKAAWSTGIRPRRSPHRGVRGPPRLLRVLLDTVDHLAAQIGEFNRLIGQTLEEMTGPPDNPVADTGRNRQVLIEHLDAIPAVGPVSAQMILAEIGLDLSHSPPPSTWSPGRSCARAPSSPGRRTPQAQPGGATAGSKEPWAKRPTLPPAPTPSSAPATGASSNAAATPKPSSRSPARSSSSPGI